MKERLAIRLSYWNEKGAMSGAAYTPAAGLHEVGEFLEGPMDIVRRRRLGRTVIADIHIALATVGAGPLSIRVYYDMSCTVRASKGWSLKEPRLARDTGAGPMIDHQVAFVRAF
jgi:hypothetical protein